MKECHICQQRRPRHTMSFTKVTMCGVSVNVWLCGDCYRASVKAFKARVRREYLEERANAEE